MKTLKQLLEKKADLPQLSSPVEPSSITAYVPKTKDEKRFMDKHVVKKTEDANGNGDDHFRATNVKPHDRSKGHGYNTGEDQKVYESRTLTSILAERHMTPAEMKKREDIAQGIEKSDPGMAMSKKMAIATSKAMKEDVDHLVEGDESHAQFQKYHDDTAKLLKHIHTGLSKHYDNVTNKKGYNSGQAHWGHVGDIKEIHRRLQDVHDSILQTGEYAKPPQVIKMKESLELFDVFAEELQQDVQTVFESLDDTNQQVMIEMIETGEYDAVVEIVKEIING